MKQKYDIFISYRRKGGIKDARLVDEKLRNSGYSVSFDIDTLGRGKFTDTLNSRLKVCKDFIVIFEPSYYERFYDEHGQVQPEDVLNEDWCYLELKKALLMEKNIIPLISKDFIFPKNLPNDIKGVAEMNAIQLTEKEFKEIFEYKVKSYLLSKPKFTYRHKKSMIAGLSLFIFIIIAYLGYVVLESQKIAAAEAAKAAAEAERAEFVKQNILDSVNKARESEKEAAKEAAAEQRTGVISSANTSRKTELYWVGNGDETGKILLGKLSGAGLKSGKCSGSGIKVAASSKPACKPNNMGVVKCVYTPQLTATTCTGAPVNKLTFAQTFNSSSKDEAVSRQKMLEDLEKANFGTWVNTLQSLKR
jgi:hypothetical protein